MRKHLSLVALLLLVLFGGAIGQYGPPQDVGFGSSNQYGSPNSQGNGIPEFGSDNFDFSFGFSSGFEEGVEAKSYVNALIMASVMKGLASNRETFRQNCLEEGGEQENVQLLTNYYQQNGSLAQRICQNRADAAATCNVEICNRNGDLSRYAPPQVRSAMREAGVQLDLSTATTSQVKDAFVRICGVMGNKEIDRQKARRERELDRMVEEYERMCAREEQMRTQREQMDNQRRQGEDQQWQQQQDQWRQQQQQWQNPQPRNNPMPPQNYNPPMPPEGGMPPQEPTPPDYPEPPPTEPPPAPGGEPQGELATGILNRLFNGVSFSGFVNLVLQGEPLPETQSDATSLRMPYEPTRSMEQIPYGAPPNWNNTPQPYNDSSEWRPPNEMNNPGYGNQGYSGPPNNNPPGYASQGGPGFGGPGFGPFSPEDCGSGENPRERLAQEFGDDSMFEEEMQNRCAIEADMRADEVMRMIERGLAERELCEVRITTMCESKKAVAEACQAALNQGPQEMIQKAVALQCKVVRLKARQQTEGEFSNFALKMFDLANQSGGDLGVAGTAVVEDVFEAEEEIKKGQEQAGILSYILGDQNLKQSYTKAADALQDKKEFLERVKEQQLSAEQQQQIRELEEELQRNAEKANRCKEASGNLFGRLFSGC